MAKNRKFLIMKEVFLGVKNSYNCTMFRNVNPKEFNWLELEEDGTLVLVSEKGTKRCELEYSRDLEKPGNFKELTVTDAPALAPA